MLTICLTVAVTVQAAPGFPPGSLLEGPVLAADTAAQDAIILYDLGTGTTRTLTFGTGWQRIWDFSPDGCRILFTMSDGSQPASLYTAHIDGSDVTELVTSDGISGAWEPQWGGNKIAYTQIDANGRHYIAWINPTTRETGTYSVSGDEHTARWSPDGQWLVYASYEERVAGADMFATAEPTRSGTVSTLLREADLWVVKADGTGKYRLTNFPVG
ncbi:MAG: PD40 domain-containing protein, partial [Anaerolineae bacterium]|nr:PD40 domain-containing protein [Anaerolineae bacterium]